MTTQIEKFAAEAAEYKIGDNVEIRTGEHAGVKGSISSEPRGYRNQFLNVSKDGVYVACFHVSDLIRVDA
ncbi:MAG TPA: hypothetical protein VK797_23105 [Tepidisphaeraceae bacterium]|jgi:hypothetical protein|nr:hypothetical protein [Tepidisphaeraceae bacterium]